MKKNYVCFCLILFVMVFGILTFSCDNGTTSSITIDTALNGTWESEHLYGHEEITFLNGDYVRSDFYNDPLRVEPLLRATYTTNNGIINLNITHYHGNYLQRYFPGIEQEWYTKDQLRQYIEDIKYDGNFDIDYHYRLEVYTYSINGDELTLIYEHYITYYTKVE